MLAPTPIHSAILLPCYVGLEEKYSISERQEKEGSDKKGLAVKAREKREKRVFGLVPFFASFLLICRQTGKEEEKDKKSRRMSKARKWKKQE